MAWETRSTKLLRASINFQSHVQLQNVWCLVDRVLKIVAVPCSTPSVYFLSSSRNVLLQALLTTGRFCIAHGIGAWFHPGQTTLREISGSDSLHISIGPGNQFDAHIDRYSPTPRHTGNILCSNDWTPEAWRHIGREAFPEVFRKYTRIPGVQLQPDFELTPTVPRPEPATRQEADPPPPWVGITWRSNIR